VSRRLTEVVTTALLDHRMFELINDGFGEGLAPAGHGDSAWVTAGRSAILVVTPFDHYRAILRLEEWDDEPGPAPDDGRGPWQDDAVTVTMECLGEDGRISLNQITAGGASTGFSVSRPGIYHVHLARRNGDAEERARAAVRAAFDSALTQAWPAITSGRR
jgi:hypothetical protein